MVTSAGKVKCVNKNWINSVRSSLKSLCIFQVVRYNSHNCICLEPRDYTCSFCRSSSESAWGLVQHVQSVHGVQIYSESGLNSTKLEIKDEFALHKKLSYPACFPPNSGNGIQNFPSFYPSLSAHLLRKPYESSLFQHMLPPNFHPLVNPYIGLSNPFLNINKPNMNTSTQKGNDLVI